MEIIKPSVKMMPALFIGHGSPENAMQDNEFTRAWSKVATLIPKPKAILCISAHWLKDKTAVTAMEKPKTIHDFYGFPEEMYRITYNAKGSIAYAEKIKKIVKSVKVSPDSGWGLDHGTWSVLVKMYPEADIPVLQLALNYNMPLEKQMQIGRELKSLREEGVLIIGSGNLVHNLGQMRQTDEPYDWAVDFDEFVKKNLMSKDYGPLINYADKKSGALAHPTYDHYLPLMYVLGMAEGENPQFFNEKIVYGSVGMRSMLFYGKKVQL